MGSTYRDVVVVGASAGGVEALKALAAGLPPDLPAAVVVVLHLPAGGTTVLAQILDRAGPLPARAATNGCKLQNGQIYVAPPDHHLLIVDHRLLLSSGPAENGYRPAVDVLFRSAAMALGPQVTGVVLSGALDDGAAGLVAIAARGGATVVQEPADAHYRGMPENALRLVEPDHVLSAGKMGSVLADLATQAVDPARAPHSSPLLMMEVDIAAHADRNVPDLVAVGEPSQLVCPDCGGTLVELADTGTPRYRCHVGHAWSPMALLAEQSMVAERALWVALRTLDEKRRLARTMLDSYGERHPAMRGYYERSMRECADAADALREILLSGVSGAQSPEMGQDPPGKPDQD
jgi:two-component system, chemotaxis family, protein-glutamate methylesterase/glutaminase